MNNRRTVIGVVVLLVVLGGIIWFTQRNKNETKNTPVLSISAFNQTKNADAASVNANANDVLVFTLNAENQTDKTIEGYVMEVNISDLTNSATLIDAQGASYNSGTNSLVWTPLDINSNESIAQQFSVRVNQVPQDTQLKVTFNNELQIPVTAQQVAGGSTNNQNNTPAPANNQYKAPTTGTGSTITLILALITTACIFFARRLKTNRA